MMVERLTPRTSNLEVRVTEFTPYCCDVSLDINFVLHSCDALASHSEGSIAITLVTSCYEARISFGPSPNGPLKFYVSLNSFKSISYHLSIVLPFVAQLLWPWFHTDTLDSSFFPCYIIWCRDLVRFLQLRCWSEFVKRFEPELSFFFSKSDGHRWWENKARCWRGLFK